MFVVWSKRPVSGRRDSDFLSGQSVFQNHHYLHGPAMRCTHGGTGRTSFVATLATSSRIDGRPRRRTVHRLPAIRSCCLADPFKRAAWWYVVDSTLDSFGECWSDDMVEMAKSRPAILAKLAEVVPRPRAAQRRPFEEWLAQAKREQKARDDAQRASERAWAREQERIRAEERQRRAREEADFISDVLNGRTANPLEAFAVLGISPDATHDEAKAAHRRMAMATHPDRNPGDPTAGARFRKVQAAWEAVEKYHRVRQAV